MIHGSSKDPVYVKKVYLKIWTLRSEIEQVIKNSEASSPESIESIKKEYSYKGPLQQDAGLTLIEGGVDGASEEEATDPTAEETDTEDVEAAAESEESPEETDSPEGTGEEGESTQVVQRGSHHLEPHQIHNGVCVLGEMSMDTFYFFTSKKFLEGQSIVIEFQVPKRFVMNAEVQYCRPFNIKSRVISENKLSCRAAATFTFLKEGERTLLRNFIKSIEPEIPIVVEAPKKSKDDDDGDFDELDGLDF